MAVVMKPALNVKCSVSSDGSKNKENLDTQTADEHKQKLLVSKTISVQTTDIYKHK